MDHYVFSAIVLALILLSAALGSHVRASLADHHFSEDSLAAMRIAVGLVATLSALVLSLLISSGKSSLDLVNTALQHNSVAMIQLDRTLSQFGPSAESLRVDIKNDYARWISFLFSNKTGTTAETASRGILQSTYDIQGRIFALQTLGPSQEKLRDHAMELWDNIFAGRWLALEHRRGSIPTPLIAVLVGWLTVIFGIFGFSAPRNWSMCVVFLLCALSATTAVFVVIDLDTPFQGMVNVSKTPMLDALKFIGR
jgi:prepilin signal peptidase PulO-like enzyme (type II secretory pathway)